MTERIEDFDEDPGLEASSRLAEDFEALFMPEFAVPPEIDRAVLDRANGHFAGREFARTGRRFRWVALWKVATAAAVVIFAFSLNLTDKPEPADHYAAVAKTGVADFDGNGQVDILDAFKLAKRIEAAGGGAAGLDINGDGTANHDDVDKVAFAAVSLSKGVL